MFGYFNHCSRLLHISFTPPVSGEEPQGARKFIISICHIGTETNASRVSLMMNKRTPLDLYSRFDAYRAPRHLGILPLT